MFISDNAKKSLKNIIRKIPLLSSLAKLFYDWNQESKLKSRIRIFLRKDKLPFADQAPPAYALGYEPTMRCNLKCKMCYQGQTRSLRREELNTEEVLNIFNKLKPKVKEIKLVGGEPFVRDDIFTLINFWQKNKTRIILQTNCTLIGENAAKTLRDLDEVTDILTSLDGPESVHDAIRGVPGAFNNLKRAIGLIKKYRPDISVTVFATMLVWDNLDNFPKLVDICRDLGIGTLNVLFEQVYSEEEVKATKNIVENILGWNKDGYRLNTQIREKLFPDDLTAKKLKKKLSQIRFYGLKKGCFVNFVPYNYYQKLEQYLTGKSSGFVASQRGGPLCLKLLSPELRINQTGDVIWCDVIEKSFGNLLEKKPDEIWLSEEYQEFREYLFRKSLPICRRCCKAAYV